MLNSIQNFQKHFVKTIGLYTMHFEWTRSQYYFKNTLVILKKKLIQNIKYICFSN